VTRKRGREERGEKRKNRKQIEIVRLSPTLIKGGKMKKTRKWHKMEVVKK